MKSDVIKKICDKLKAGTPKSLFFEFNKESEENEAQLKELSAKIFEHFMSGKDCDYLKNYYGFTDEEIKEYGKWTLKKLNNVEEFYGFLSITMRDWLRNQLNEYGRCKNNKSN